LFFFFLFVFVVFFAGMKAGAVEFLTSHFAIRTCWMR
jgi:hypothetical protein